MNPRVSLCLCVLPFIACAGTTGGERVAFSAAAAGPAGMTSASFEFQNRLGYHVLLDRADLHIGAVYLNQNNPTSGNQATGCVSPGTYVAEVLSSLDVDALSAKPQKFHGLGQGIALPAQTAELWLTGGPVDRIDDTTEILGASGVADKDGQTYPFEARITITHNRLITNSDPAFPGANPICKQRIVSRIPADLTPRSSGELLVRADPRGWFATVDFSALAKCPDDSSMYCFSNSAEGPPDISLYNGLRSRTSFQVTWR
jgi:hypothetical protein